MYDSIFNLRKNSSEPHDPKGASYLLKFIEIKCLDSKSTEDIYYQIYLVEAPEVGNQINNAVLSSVSYLLCGGFLCLLLLFSDKVERTEEGKN